MDRDWLFHDSHAALFRSPFGAVSSDARLTLRLAVRAPAPPERVLLRLWREAGGEEVLAMAPGREEARGRLYQAEVDSRETPGLIWYYFIVTYRGRDYFYGAGSAGRGGAGRIYPESPPAYQITVHAAAAATPHWFKDAIIYQIFVDRFFNGHPDGRIENPPRGSLIHPYWDDTPFYVRDMKNGHIFAYDFFGGNLQGVLAKLPYLRELGVSVIYFNPVFESPSNHKYDTGDYKAIDPMFGDNELFRQLCAEAGKLGIAIILDGVFSHTGSDSRYFNRNGRYPDLGAYQSPQSPYYNWYRFTRYPDEYESWWGIDTLPNVNELEPSYLDFIIDGRDSVLKHWLRAGVKGWRLDVADELPDRFIQRLRAGMKEEDPDAVLIGEVWEDASRKESYGVTRKYLLGDELDSVTNYPFREIVLGFLLGAKDAAETQGALFSLYENYPREHFYAAMNLVGTHDVPRILTLLGEAPDPDRMTVIEQAQYRLPGPRRSMAVKRLKMAALWQMTFPGAPCIYYGDEAGLEGYADPFNRGTYPWGREDRELLDWYRRLTGLRQRHAVLRTGELSPLPVAGDVYGYVRKIEHNRDVFGRVLPNNAAVALLNRSREEERQVSLDVGDCGDDYLYDALSGELVELKDGTLAVALPPLSSRLFLARREEVPSLERSSGILLHPTSLPSPFGSGDMGPEAYAFVDWLQAAGQRFWQILPLNPPGYGESPYQSASAFAGNPWLISPEKLVEEGWLNREEIAAPPAFPVTRADFPTARAFKEPLLRKAFRRFAAGREPGDYRRFCDDNSLWLEHYCLFMALKAHLGDGAWQDWEEPLARRDTAALAFYRDLLADDLAYQRFLQYCFFRQWRQLKEYANSKGIRMIGDLPIFISGDSSDAWANPGLFELDGEGRPVAVAGVPPDYFSATGQLWGNPHYNWPAMAADGYAWWRARLEQLFRLADLVRIDHFRGFEASWQVPAAEDTAMHGQWVKGPGAKFFAVVEDRLGRLPLIAEDLGVITPPVERLRDMFNYPGMKVLQFMLEDGRATAEAFRFEENAVVYTGTHDNDTTLGWYECIRKTRPEAAENIAALLGMTPEDSPLESAWRFIGLAMGTDARLAVIPLQDVLGLGSEARMNIPGTVGGNWDWRVAKTALTGRLAERLAGLVRSCGR
ncbi:MAG TPA: bifunctional glycogen debranching protein GlgX/4-alpha-glucanotransferase [Selenomonadales bacterium]|nr:bifunctional glycogen debranching protein GlgX/4-alpha-glucanotransferase [Selenomonadales bacterium]